MKMNPISESDFRIARVIRWILFMPAMYCAAFMTGLMLIPIGRPGKVLAILLSALAGIAIAPKYRVWATVIAFFYGNYLYATNINYIYHENYAELLTGYGNAIVRQGKLFLVPTILTFIAAVLMDRRSRKLEYQRAMKVNSPDN